MTDPDRLASILALVETSLDEPDLDGAELAARAFLSRFHFDRLVSGALGEPPGAFRRRLLLERSAFQLRSTSAPVIEVALGAGYDSPEAFTRAFGHAFGCPPSTYRARRTGRTDIPGPSGVHFHPPGGLRLPAPTRSTTMDVLVAMLDHHLELSGAIVDRIGALPDSTLDQPITSSVEGIDADPTLRSVAARLVSQLEMWVAALEGGAAGPFGGDQSPAALRSRLDAAGPRFRELVVGPLVEGRAEETFIDVGCEPPETFSYGGVLAHVLTFSAVRRTMAIGALETAGVTDLGSGDPMTFVGGTGSDASTIRRRTET